MGLFPENRMIPFGSSVTGFGDDQSDVDLCWSLSFHMHSVCSPLRLFLNDCRFVDAR
jgi:hypothetical protein